jgi:AcrR family transcriptional regulator
VARNRQNTEAKIIQAVATVLEHDGFEKVGVNLVARTASVDKVLIYRYFGGLDGLLAAFGESADIWWTVDEIIGGDLPGPKQDTLSAWCILALTRQVEALRQRPVTQQILLWELSQSNALTQHLNQIREERMQQLVRRVIERGGKRADARLMAVHGLLGGASEYLVLRTRQSQSLMGMDFSSDAGWRRLEASVSALVRAVFAEDEA